MHVKLSKLLPALALAALPLVPGAIADEIMAPTFKLDFREELQAIEATSRAAQPLNQTLSKGINELKAAIEKANADPNMLNKSEFELKYAGYIQKVIQDMDALTVHRDQTIWAFEDITQKLRDATARIEQQSRHGMTRLERQQDMVKVMDTELKKLAREVRVKGGENAPKELQRQLMREYRRMQNAQVNMNTLQALKQQQDRIREMLDKYTMSLDSINSNMDGFFDGMLDMRDAFREMAENKADLTRITQLISQPGMGSLRDTMEKLSGIMNRLQEFSGTMLNMNSTLNEIGGVDLPDMGPTDIESVLSEILEAK